MIAFVTPVYYFGMTAKLKTFIDKFCAFNRSQQNKKMRSALLSVAWNNDNWTFDDLEMYYKTLACRSRKYQLISID